MIMRKIIYSFLILASSAVLFTACGDVEPIIYDGDPFVSYLSGTEGRYVVLSNNAPYSMEVGIPYPLDEDLEVGIKVVYATGTQGEQFDIQESVKIRAGEVSGSFFVYGYSAAMTDRTDTLIVGIDHEFASRYESEYTLVMQPPCEFILEDYIGDYTAFEQSDYEDQPYTPYTVNFAENPNGGDTLIVTGMWPGEPFKIVFNVDNPPDYTFNIPDQFLLADLGGYGETRIQDEGSGIVQTCDLTMTIRYQIYVSEGFFERALITFVKD
jgi:hypothetical protein